MPLRRPLAVLLLVALTPAAQAQFGPSVPETVATWTASVRPPSTAEADTDVFRPGEPLFVTLTAEVVPGWHVYALDSPGGRPLQIELDPLPEGLSLYGSPGQDTPREGFDEGLGEAYRYHAGRARVWQGLRVAPRAARGPVVVSGRLRSAACNDQICLPPREVPFQARFTVAP
jgi:DsbC/DsbD-like thiol-disulfide interchange protein